MKYPKCLHCDTIVDHAPGGPFCKVVQKAAKSTLKIMELETALAERDRKIQEIQHTVVELEQAFAIIKGRHQLGKGGNA